MLMLRCLFIRLFLYESPSHTESYIVMPQNYMPRRRRARFVHAIVFTRSSGTYLHI